jgi:hypothetical protein
MKSISKYNFKLQMMVLHFLYFIQYRYQFVLPFKDTRLCYMVSFVCKKNLYSLI